MDWLGTIKWPEGIKKRACRYLLQRYFGQFLNEKLTLDQLTIDLYNGRGRVTNVSLDVQALNEMGEQLNLPFEFIDGYITEMSLSIPWTALLHESTYVEVNSLKLTVKPKQRAESASFMFESMLSSMSSSMQQAQEYLKADPTNNENVQPIEGVEIFAQAIDSILRKTKIRFKDTVIRIEHVPLDSSTGIAIQIVLKNLEYSDEAELETNMTQHVDIDHSPKNNTSPAITTKHFYLEDISFYIDEFPSALRTMSKSFVSSSGGVSDSTISDALFYSTQLSPPQNKSTDNTVHFHENNSFDALFEAKPIIFAKLLGRQEIRLKLKQGEGVSGPKVELEITLGSFTSFISPRQVHVLKELTHGLTCPDLEDMSTIISRQCIQKPMIGADYYRVEKDLMYEINKPRGSRTTDLRNAQGWSTASACESDDDGEEFLPMQLVNSTPLNESVISNNCSMEESISTSSVSSKSSVNNLTKQHKPRHSMDDASAETSQFHITISSIAIILLHEDILTTCVKGISITNTSRKQMIDLAEDFFQKLNAFSIDGYGNKDFEKASKLLLDACSLSHIRLIATPLEIEGNEKTTSVCSVISGTLTLANLEIIECLIDSQNSNSNENPATEFIELLGFPKENTDKYEFFNKTNFKMKFKHTKKAVRRAQMIKFTHPHTEIDIQLEPFRSEVDITIVDRISALLNSQPICIINPAMKTKNTNQQTLFYQAVESPVIPNSRIDIKISSSCAIIKLRFPIPDLRPVHDIKRTPWWKRSVRPDYMIWKMTDAQIHTSKEGRSPYSARYEVQFRHLTLSYVEVDGDTPIEICRANAEEKSDGSYQHIGEGFGCARIVITIYPPHLGGPLEDSSEGELDSSLDDAAPYNTPKHQPSPFSSKRVIHQSDTPHSKFQPDGEEEDLDKRESEELVIPGSREEMFEFIEEATRGTRVQLEISLPSVSIQIPSKHLYELIYNRFNIDLFLWEPSAPRPNYNIHVENHIGLDITSTLFQELNNPKFSMCKSGIHNETDSDTDNEDEFHSTFEKNYKQNQLKFSKNKQSKFALTISINQGLLTIHTPVRDSTRNVIPGQQGELILQVEEAMIFSVTAYKGNPCLGYICAMIKNASLSHCGLTTSPLQTPPLKSVNSAIPKHCHQIIYKCKPGANIKKNSPDKDMITVAVRVQSAQQTQRVKTFRIAVGSQNVTLRHKMCATATSWYTQLMDYFDVADHPVAGYMPPGILTEMHLHFWDCTIDYRPIYLPLRSMITLGNFSISSNITALTNTSTLRFIAEDIALFISDKLGTKVSLRDGYVCVMDLSLFELSLRLNDKMCNGTPRVDLRASNNVLHVRTCSDSGHALMQLLNYFASDGDLVPNCGSTENMTAPNSVYEESLLGEENLSTLSKSQVERVNSLMEEAMQETVMGTTSNNDKKTPIIENQVEVFFFPDESEPSLQTVNNGQKNVDERILLVPDNAFDNSNEDDDEDEDFCILGEEAGEGIMPRHGVPEIRWLCQESLKIVENHFSLPTGKTDLLKAPKNFPDAILRYTLCEMTLIWHIYGGKDFESSRSVSKKRVSLNDGGSRNNNPIQGRSRSAVGGVCFSKANPNEVRFGSVPNSPKTRINDSSIDWHILGGPGRQHDVLMELQLNKVRFQHEVYPESRKEASRQILLINEIEIRDRLASSHINKFLYQYSSEAKPRQSHANMFVLKAVHIRPDPLLSAQECCLKLSVLPLRLNIDQDSLLFLIDFLNELCNGPKQSPDNLTKNSHSLPVSKQGTPTHHPPVMSVNESKPTNNNQNALIPSEVVDQNLIMLLEEELTIKENKAKTKTVHEIHEDCQPIYFRSVVFAPEVLVRLDYHGKRVDLTHGSLAGLLMGLAQLNCSELRLKRLCYRHGLLGFDKLMGFLLSEWSQDIKKNQLPSLLGGVGPMYSLVQLFQGIRDLFWLPIEQYQKDGRIVRGLQRGANSFTTSTAMATLELTSRLVNALQSTAETAYDMVSPGPSVRIISKGQKGRRKRYAQPLDIREGMANAYLLVKEGLGETATQLVRVASEEHEQKGVSGAVGGVLRQIPPTVVKPIILATEATSNVLGGMRSQLVPDARREAAQKWRDDSHNDK